MTTNDSSSKNSPKGNRSSRNTSPKTSAAEAELLRATKAEAAKTGLWTRDDGVVSCWWPGADGEYQRYHDEEWGQPVIDDVRLFEKLCLEGFQAGLSWLTILRKRDNFRDAFAGFDPTEVARFDASSVEKLVTNEGIIRHRGKIEAAINNAGRALELIDEQGSLAHFVWSFEPSSTDRPKRLDFEAVSQLTTSPASTALSKDLKKRGWKFVGPTTMYAFLQSMGVVNDHVEGCHCRPTVEVARKALARP